MKKNKVLKNLFLCFFVVAGGACFSISKDSALFKKIHSAYSGADYPAVIEYSSRLQKDFSSSPFLEKALLCKGESFFYLGRFEDSIQTLNELSSSEKNETKIFCFRCACGKFIACIDGLRKNEVTRYKRESGF